MRSAAVSLFAVGTLAAPSVMNHKHRHAQRHAAPDVDVVYTTCYETDIATKWVTVGPNAAGSTDAPVAAAGDNARAGPPAGHPAPHHDAGKANASALPQAPASAPAPAPAPAPSAADTDDDEDDEDTPAPSAANAGANAAAPAVASASSLPADVVSVAQQYKNAPSSAAAMPLSSFVPASSAAAAPASNAAPATGGSSAPSVPSAPASSSASSSAAAPSNTGSTPPGNYPFKNIVIFGDNLSDRGNGSSDHNMAGDPETIYGYKTWTDGPIAAEVLSNDLDVPILYDFAFGHSDGGKYFGATVDNTFTQSMANAPSAADQIKNYTSSGFYNKGTVGETLHFLWIGNNDVIPWNITTHFHPMPDNGATDPANAQFATDLAALITKQASTLVDAGAEHVFVPNVYNRHVAPVVQRYFSNSTSFVKGYGDIISAVNTALKSDLADLQAKCGKKITYYDAFGFLMDTYNAAKENQSPAAPVNVKVAANGITKMTPGEDICDGAFINPDPSNPDPVAAKSSLGYCATGHGGEFFWMQYLDPTAKVHAMLAADMKSAIDAAYA